jgi:hypothetical protein
MTMTRKKSALLITLTLVLAAGGAFAYYSSNDVEGDKAGASETANTAPLNKAGFSFAITDIEREGNVVSFTIPKDARALEAKADTFVLSGLYAADQKTAKEDCPVVQSNAVNETVQDYNAFNGKARVTADFDDEETAKAAEESGCLLINDPS